MPQNSRNFLAFADTVPGVKFVTERRRLDRVRSGAQAANGVNVFIDGVGQKNYVLRGGVSGQDAQRAAIRSRSSASASTRSSPRTTRRSSTS